MAKSSFYEGSTQYDQISESYTLLPQVEAALAGAQAAQAAAELAEDHAQTYYEGMVAFGVESFNTRTGAVVAASGDYTAAQVTNTPSGTISATTVQAALDELDNEKAVKATSLTAGAGLTGGGDLSTSRTFAVGAGTGITVNTDDVALDTANTRNSDHASVTLTAGAGLTGGGDITTSRSFAVGAGTGITVNADDVALANMPANTIKGNNTGGSAAPVDLTAAQTAAMLPAFVGDSGSGGTKGLVPTPAAGDSVKYLRGDGVFASVTSSNIPDEPRRNILLNSVYGSKAIADFRRLVNTLAIGFNGATDAANAISTGSSSNYTVSTANGTVAPSRTETVINISALTKIGDFVSGTPANLYDGVTDQAVASCATTSAAIATARFGVDLGVGVSKAITGLKTWGANDRGYAGSGDTSNITITLKAANSDPTGTGWTGATIGTVAVFANSAATNAKTSLGNANTTGYRWVWVEVSKPSASSLAVLAEVEFYESPLNNMTVVTVAQTTDSSVSNSRVLIEYSGTGTLNTDITVDVSCDGGSHWTAATLTQVTAYAGGSTVRILAETADTACTAGTSFQVRLKTLNNKDITFTALAAVVH